MNVDELKNYIKMNNKTEFILESLGCTKLRQLGNQIRGALPGHKNPNSLCINLDTLSAISYDDEVNFTGDIITLVEELKHIKFIDALKYLCSTLGIQYDYTYTSTEEFTNPFDEIFGSAIKIYNGQGYKYDKDEEENIFNLFDTEEYIFLPHINWIREGILPCAFKKFNIGYDIKSKRIIVPHHKWDGAPDEWVGITGRTTLPNYELLGIPKYMSMRKEKFAKTKNIYGLYENKEFIQQEGEVVVFEAEKSVLKRYSYGDKTAVALCGHSMSNEQRDILLSLKVDIVIAMDKGIDLSTILDLCAKVYSKYSGHDIYFIYDAKNKISGKDSPADLPDTEYYKIYETKIKYTPELHKVCLEKFEQQKEQKVKKYEIDKRAIIEHND